ncbi:MAG: zf-HC2 domain-containing protein [Bacteroidota bacterium]
MKQSHGNIKKHIHTLSCGKVYEHLCDNLDAKLDSESCRRIKAHIKGCKNCSALLDSLKKTVYLYKQYPAPALPEQSRKKLFAVIHMEKAKKRPAR